MKVLFFFLFCFTAVLNSAATTNSWTGAGGDNLWSNPLNWSRGEFPTMEDEVFITQPGTYTVNVDIQADAATLVIGGTSGKQTLRLSESVLAHSVVVSGNGIILSSANSDPGFLYYNIFASITNDGTIRLEEGLTVEGVFCNNGLIDAAPGLGETLLHCNEAFVNHGSISIGTNTTLALSGELSLLGSPLSTGAGVLELHGSVEFSSEVRFETDVILVTATVSGNSILSGPGNFHMIYATFVDGSTILASNFTCSVAGEDRSAYLSLNNHRIKNYGQLTFETGAIIDGNAALSFEGFPNSVDNFGTIRLESYCWASGLLNRGAIVATNDMSQLISEGVGVTSFGGHFVVEPGAKLELMGSFSFQDQTFFTSGGELVFLGVNLDGSGEIFVENEASLVGAVRGDFVWKGPGKLRFHEGALGGYSGLTPPSGSTTIAQGFTLETAEQFPPKQFSHNITNFGLIKMVTNTRLFGAADVVNKGTIDIQSGASFSAINLLNEGTIAQTNGTLEIFDTMTNDGALVLASGLVKIIGGCSSFDCLNGSGKYVAGPNASHLFTIEGYASQSDFPRLLTWDFSAGGSIDVQFANGFMPTNRSSFKLWEYQTASNNFTSANLPTLSPPMFWETVFHRNQYTIRTREPNHPTATLQSQYDSDGVTLTLAVPNGIAYELEASTNLVHWTTVWTNFTGSYYYQFPPQINQRPENLFFRTFEP